MEVIFALIGIALYFIPSFLGSDRKDAVSIFLFNLLFGWTVVCWFIAIIWAVTSEASDSKVIHTHTTIKQHDSAVDQIMKLTILKDKGAITEDEYQKEKDRILNT